MSTYTLIRVYCDAEGCQETFNQSTNGASLSRSWVLRLASEEGWAISKGGDLTRCPQHRRPIKTHAFVPGPGSFRACNAKAGTGWCFKLQNHPVHGGDR